MVPDLLEEVVFGFGALAALGVEVLIEERRLLRRFFVEVEDGSSIWVESAGCAALALMSSANFCSRLPHMCCWKSLISCSMRFTHFRLC